MPKNKNRPLLEKITQSPLLINASSEALFQASIQHIVTSEHAETLLGSTETMNSDDDFWPTEPKSYLSMLRPYNVRDGILQIPVMGVLLNRFPYQYGQWATGYQYIEKALQRGLADEAVKAIAFVIDSPGGEVAGCFELGDKIYEARGKKPMRSFAADHAFSAAYLLGSSPGEIVVTRSGGVGSIGVVTAHVEYSKMLEDMGVKVTFIFAGEHKVDGNAYEKLPDDVKSRIQARINRLYGEFTSTVARNREMDEKAVRDTKALTYDANEAIVVGLADRIGALEDEMTIFSEEATVTENEQMANDKQAPEVKGIDQATHDAAVATARTEGASAEKGRIKAILACDEGKNRPKAAFSCAMNTEMSLEEAKAFLADLPEEKALAEQPAKAEQPAATAPGKTPFETAMDSSGNPDVGVELRAAEDEDLGDDAKAAESILAAYASATGKKRKVA